MSLSIAIDQIQRPTWWAIEQPSKRTSPATVQEKYEKVMECLNATGGQAVNCAHIEDYTGYTTQSCRHITARLIEMGKVQKITTGTHGNLAVTFKAINQ